VKSEAILAHHIRPTPDDVCLRRLVEFFGLDCRAVDTSTFDVELQRAADHDLCILASAATIDRWCHSFPDVTIALGRLRQKASFLFVFGFTPEMSALYIAGSLSDGAITDVRKFTGTDSRYHVSSSQPEITREFSGLSFGCVRNASDFGFVCSEDSRNMVPLVNIDGTPFWAVVEKDRCHAFLLACSTIADIEEQIHGNLEVTSYFSRLLPAAMFLKSVFKSRCWHSKHSFGNFIIDDPPLKRSYGYLNYRDLVSKMDKLDFASTIAFIPWNYRRIDKEVAQLFRERPDRLSLCVHGCDHTGGEFSSTDMAVLNSKVQLASARMKILNRQSGLWYSKAMVFPQGRFSTEALTALKSNNYFAAINSSALAANSAAKAPLTVGDFLQPASTRYGDFPVFLRRYPGASEQFAFDLFFGKPLLAVEHHSYLKDGGARLTEFISRLNSFETLQWTGLHEVLTKSHLERETDNEITLCRLFTNHHIIENSSERERVFIVTKFESGDVPIQTILVNDEITKFRVTGNLLEFKARVRARSSIVVNIVYRNLLPRIETGRGVATRSRVWTRRMLSEFRDNVLLRSDLLLASAQAVHRGLSDRSVRDTARRHQMSPWVPKVRLNDSKRPSNQRSCPDLG
jgi:hypothetical protein